MRVTGLLIVVLSCVPVLWSADEPKPKETSRYIIGPTVQPMVIIGEGWTQQFTFINVSYYQGGDPTVGTLYFFTKDGQRWRVPLKKYGLTDHVDVSLQPGQMLILDTEVSWDKQQLGWAYFELSTNIALWGNYHAFSVYRNQAPNRPDFMTSLPMVDGLEDEWIVPFDNAGGKYPGIALVNTSTYSTTTFLLQVYDENGTIRKTITKRLAPLSLVWFSLLGENPELAEMRGQIKVSGGLYSSAVLSLQFAPNGAFTALPMVHTYGMN